jgi:Leucine-rich repeat (LRR) protein
VSDLSWLSGLSSLKFLDMSAVNLSLTTGHWLESINTIPSLTELHLESSNLDTVPKSLPYLNLTSLSVLDLSLNNFNTEAPQWLYNISSSVRVLKLSGCHFKGPISSLLGNGYDSNLEELGLHFNDFDGELPDSLNHLESLRILRLFSNSVSGQIPHSLGTLSELNVLDLSYNKWEGSVSEDHFRGLSKLKELSISSSNRDFALNFSRDWVPPFSLRSINISGHNLGPDFPKWLQNQSQLEFVGLKSVNISGTIPAWVWKISRYIQWLDLSFNQLRGSVLSSPAIFSPDALIDLSFNFFEGQIPVFQNASILYLGNNSFSGTIPANIDQLMPRLVLLDIFGNKLNGSIPSSLGKVEGLLSLDLSNNNFSGNVHDKWMNTMLTALDLSDNNLSGKFPASLCSLPFLSELKLSNNTLHGELPLSVSECKSLTVLDLGENGFNGIIPKWIGESRSLQQLRMRGNFFNGSIGKGICRLQRLHILDLAQNNLSGSIPKCLGRINGMKSADQDSSQRSNLDVNLKGNKYTYSRYALKLVILIDLSCNDLIGIIPENMTNLIGLGTLNLSNNHLTGRIPFNIGELQNLETLDLSSNNFSGQIPPSMSSMTFLSNLNFSHNNLSGRIPSGNQFQTFDASTYTGNVGLCGSPLSTKCESPVAEEGQDDDNKNEHEDEKDNKLGIYVTAALGFVFGFWSICGSLIISKSWRDAYYGYLVRVKDRVMLAISMISNKLQRRVRHRRSTN